ncbi:hypothetical protein Glove_208g173 [Diversispora epigaea]|uniref:BTB domain-containing protein n=1 Tax=Diversispora epigaea TaxID=1348612 RepID=A0A397IS16_9GLOM|nr:hypothetical protein Glove_208g173 [Diversispora epigaea]
MTSHFFTELSNDIGKLYENKFNSDVIIQVGEREGDYKEFRAHSIILSVRSSYFQSAFSSNWVKKDGNFLIFKKPNISPFIFDIILRYLYLATIDLNKLSKLEILWLLIAADELNLHTLIENIQLFAINKKDEFYQFFLSNQDSIDILQIIFHHEACSSFREIYIKIICINAKLFFASSTFLNLDESILKILLKQDDLALDEFEILKYLMKWGITQLNFHDFNSFNSFNDFFNNKNWTEKEFKELKIIIQGLIPFIRFYQISAKDFQKEITTFKYLLSKELFENFSNYHQNSRNTRNSQNIQTLDYYYDVDNDFIDHIKVDVNLIDLINLTPRNFENSRIISSKHFNQLRNWIKNVDNNNDNNNQSCGFKLLYRASQDGFEIKTFHNLCDNQGATITIAKLKNSHKIIGGFNPLSWQPYDSSNGETCSWGKTNESFLFLFDNNNNNNNNKIARVDNSYSSHAISYINSKGPCFGYGWDLVICDNTIEICFTYNYFDSAGFLDNNKIQELEDYEVFKVFNI